MYCILKKSSIQTHPIRRLHHTVYQRPHQTVNPIQRQVNLIQHPLQTRNRMQRLPQTKPLALLLEQL